MSMLFLGGFAVTAWAFHLCETLLFFFLSETIYEIVNPAQYWFERGSIPFKLELIDIWNSTFSDYTMRSYAWWGFCIYFSILFIIILFQLCTNIIPILLIVGVPFILLRLIFSPNEHNPYDHFTNEEFMRNETYFWEFKVYNKERDGQMHSDRLIGQMMEEIVPWYRWVYAKKQRFFWPMPKYIAAVGLFMSYLFGILWVCAFVKYLYVVDFSYSEYRLRPFMYYIHCNSFWFHIFLLEHSWWLGPLCFGFYSYYANYGYVLWYNLEWFNDDYAALWTELYSPQWRVEAWTINISEFTGFPDAKIPRKYWPGPCPFPSGDTELFPIDYRDEEDPEWVPTVSDEWAANLGDDEKLLESDEYWMYMERRRPDGKLVKIEVDPEELAYDPSLAEHAKILEEGINCPHPWAKPGEPNFLGVSLVFLKYYLDGNAVLEGRALLAEEVFRLWQLQYLFRRIDEDCLHNRFLRFWKGPEAVTKQTDLFYEKMVIGRLTGDVAGALLELIEEKTSRGASKTLI